MGALISFIILVTFPFNFLISQFTLKGNNSQDIDLSGKSSTHACWCYLLGLIFNVIHISLFEWYTSHGCSKVRNLVNYSIQIGISNEWSHYVYESNIFQLFRRFVLCNSSGSHALINHNCLFHSGICWIAICCLWVHICLYHLWYHILNWMQFIRIIQTHLLCAFQIWNLRKNFCHLLGS